MKKHSFGFTVLEFLVVLAIILILVAILLPSLQKAREQSFDDKKVTDLKTIALGIEQFKQACGFYPPVLLGSQPCYNSSNNTLKDFVSNIDDFKFNIQDGEYMYAAIALDQANNPSVCDSFHLGVKLTGETVGTLSEGDSNFTSTGSNMCAGLPPISIDGNDPHIFDIHR